MNFNSLILTTVFLPASLVAQNTSTWDIDILAHGPDDQTYRGAEIVAAGDVNGDGIADILLGSPYATANKQVGAGSVLVYSGANGHFLHQHWGRMGSQTGRAVAGIGDVNADGKDDYAFSFLHSSGYGHVNICSGADGSVIRVHNDFQGGTGYGTRIASVRDFDGDGVLDYLITSPFTSNSGSGIFGALYVYSGATGDELQSLHPSTFSHMGPGLLSDIDANFDGIDDLFVQGSAGGQSFFSVYSGQDLSLIYSTMNGWWGNSWTNAKGARNAGDVDRDGVDDLMMDQLAINPKTGQLRYSGATLYSGQTGLPIRQILSRRDIHDSTDFTMFSGEDLNGDRVPDQILCFTPMDGAEVYCGATGKPLAVYENFPAPAWKARSIAYIGDIDGNGKEDLAFCNSEGNVPNGTAGTLFVAKKL